MKALFRIDRITPGLGSSIILFNHVQTTGDDFKGTGGFSITVYDPEQIAKYRTGDTYQVEITNTADLPAATAEQTAPEADNTEELTENNNNLNKTHMSIFTKVGDFFANLVEKIKELWDNFSPDLKTDVNYALSASSILLQMVSQPASLVLQVIESVIGAAGTDKIKSVLTTVVQKLGIVAGDINDPEQLLQLILTDFSQVTGDTLLDKAENFEKYIVQALNPDDIDRVQAAQLAQYAKSHFFTAPSVPVAA